MTCLHYRSSQSKHWGMTSWLNYIIDISWNKHRIIRHKIHSWIHSEFTNASTPPYHENPPIARNFSPSADRSCSSGLNGSKPKQIIHNKVRILFLEAINTWNTIFDGVMWFFCYDKRSPRKYLHKHIKHTRDQRYQNIIYRSMPVTKESENNM